MGILQPHLSYRFRLIFDDHMKDYNILTQQVQCVEIDQSSKIITVTFFEPAYDMDYNLVLQRLADIQEFPITVEYINGAHVIKRLRYVGRTTSLKTVLNYAESGATKTVMIFAYRSMAPLILETEQSFAA